MRSPEPPSADNKPQGAAQYGNLGLPALWRGFLDTSRRLEAGRPCCAPGTAQLGTAGQCPQRPPEVTWPASSRRLGVTLHRSAWPKRRHGHTHKAQLRETRRWQVRPSPEPRTPRSPALRAPERRPDQARDDDERPARSGPQRNVRRNVQRLQPRCRELCFPAARSSACY